MEKYFDDWTNKFLSNIRGYNITNLFKQFEDMSFETKFKDILSYSQINQVISLNITGKFSYQNNKSISLHLSDFISHFFLYKIHKYRRSFYKSFDSLKTSFSNLCDFFQEWEDFASLSPLLKYFIKLLYHIVIEADKELSKKNEDQSCTNECGRILISFFSKFKNEEDKQPVFYCVVCLMRIYFKLRTYRNSLTLVNWIETNKLDMKMIPQCESSTYYFYQGRLSLYELKISDAQRILTKAFDLCYANISSKEGQYNSQLVFEYLIPLNLFSGIFPKKEMLEMLQLTQYAQLVDSIKNGNLLLFEKTLDSIEDRLIQLGTFLIVGKLKPYVLRMIIKLIFKAQQEELEKMKTPVLKLDLILNVLRNSYGYNGFDLEELELNVIGILYRGLIAGYVHNVNKVIVFAKNNPFPNLKELFKNNYSKII